MKVFWGLFFEPWHLVLGRDVAKLGQIGIWGKQWGQLPMGLSPIGAF